MIVRSLTEKSHDFSLLMLHTHNMTFEFAVFFFSIFFFTFFHSIRNKMKLKSIMYVDVKYIDGKMPLLLSFSI